MPMYDFVCRSCSHHEEHFFRMSSVPAHVKCEACGSPSPRSFDPTLICNRPRRALGFAPIVVHRTLGPDGQHVYSYPGNASDPVPDGYEKVELSSIAQADRFVKDRNAEETELRRMTIQGERDYWDERSKDRREVAKQQLASRLGKSDSRIGALVQRTIDARREAKYQALNSRPINFHLEVIDYDSSNRKEYRDDSRRKISVVVNGSRG